MQSIQRRVVMTLLCPALLAACGGYGRDAGPTEPASGTVTLTQSSAETMHSTGDSLTVTAVVRDADQAIVVSPSLSWSSSAPAVATVSGSGTTATVTAVDDGTATITATTGTIQSTVKVTVHRVLTSVVVLAPSPTLVFGSTMQLEATGRDARDHVISGASLTYLSSNESAVIVSASGLATAIFQFPQLPVAYIAATMTRDGMAISGVTRITVVPPPAFDFGAFMLAEYEQPLEVPGTGAGIAYFSVATQSYGETRVHYTVAWSALHGSAISAHIHGPAAADEVEGVLVDLLPPSQTTTYGAVTGSFGASDIRARNGRPPISIDSVIALMRNNVIYVDLHSFAYPGGEIRGQFEGPFGVSSLPQRKTR